MFIHFLCLFITFSAQATMFQMQPIDQQIKEADGIIVGHYLKSNSIELEDGSISTQMIFKMNKEFGLQSDFFGMDEVIVHYPGGKIGDRHVKVEGVPSFVPGEHVVLMIKGHEDRYWGMNLGFGTFKVVSYGNETMLVNTIFPENTQVGQVKIVDFERKVRNIKGTSLKVVMQTQYLTEEGESDLIRGPASLAEGKNRAIASSPNQVENEKEQPRFNTLWLLAFLATLGGLFRLTRQKITK